MSDVILVNGGFENIHAAKKALADVRTLDAFNPNWRMALAPDDEHYCLPRGDALAFVGKTPDEARSGAATWIRSLPKGE